MASFYYEIADVLVDYQYAGKYHVIHSQTGDAVMAGGFNITSSSERIWKEDSSGVRFLKNRYTNVYDTVDLKEFMWIKLKAQDLKERVD